MDEIDRAQAAARRHKLMEHQKKLLLQKQMIRRRTSGPTEANESFQEQLGLRNVIDRVDSSLSSAFKSDSVIVPLETTNHRKSIEKECNSRANEHSSYSEDKSGSSVQDYRAVFNYKQYTKRKEDFKTSPQSNRNIHVSEEINMVSSKRHIESKSNEDVSMKNSSKKTLRKRESSIPVPIMVEPKNNLDSHSEKETIPKPQEVKAAVSVPKKLEKPVSKAEQKRERSNAAQIPKEEPAVVEDERQLIAPPRIKKKRNKRPMLEKKLEEEKETKIELPKECEEKTEHINLSNIRNFITKPTTKKCGIVECYIERNKVGTTRKIFPEYHLFLKEDDKFILAGKKRAKNRTSNYIVSMDPNDLHRYSENCVGKLRSNFLGTEFQIFDSGMNPFKKSGKKRSKENFGDDNDSQIESERDDVEGIRTELGAILYASNILGSRGPRKMRAVIPVVKDDGSRVICKAASKKDGLLSKFKRQEFDDMLELVNKAPRWNDQVGAYVLNFNGRVTMASVKNFQLVLSEDEDRVVLQFGRVGKDLFTMDYAWPLSPLQAFSICLSSFDSKIACE